jgi:biotin carboxylase
MAQPLTVLCLSSSYKGVAFLTASKAIGCRVILITDQQLEHEDWPRESIDEIYFMPNLGHLNDVVNAVSYLCRSQVIDIVIPLDEYEIETCALLREHLRLPGMGQTPTRFWRDKLAMRMKTRDAGVLVPEFVHVLNYDNLRDYMSLVPPPWVLKPRTEAGAMGIKKLNDSEELWRTLDTLGDKQSYYLMEQFVPGEVYHVDSIVWENEIRFVSVQRYGRPPLSVSHDGGIFTTRTLDRESEEAVALQALNQQVIGALGMKNGVTHAEYIHAYADGRFYFLEIAARVGGANISDMIEQATGINLWAEWAKLEAAQARGEAYQVPTPRDTYGGLLISLARQEFPDMSAYNDPEIVWRLNKKQHAGLIVVSPDAGRVESLLDSYVQRFASDFLAVAPPKETARHE